MASGGRVPSQDMGTDDIMQGILFKAGLGAMRIARLKILNGCFRVRSVSDDESSCLDGAKDGASPEDALALAKSLYLSGNPFSASSGSCLKKVCKRYSAILTSLCGNHPVASGDSNMRLFLNRANTSSGKR